MDIKELLNSSYIFKDLRAADSELLVSIVHRHGFARGDVFFEEGEPSKTIYLIENGNVNITKKTAGMKKVINALSVGDLFGEMAFIDQLPRSAGAEAASDGVIWSMTAVDFARILGQMHSATVVKIMLRFLQAMSKRLRETTEQVKDIV